MCQRDKLPSFFHCHVKDMPNKTLYLLCITWQFLHAEILCKHHMDLEMAAKPYLENYWEVLDTNIFWVNLTRIDWLPNNNKGIEISDPTTY
jgi:hypothetical protein